MRSQAILKVVVCAVFVALLGLSGQARAQSIIKQPGNHPDYSFELEPHIAFQWADRFGSDDGFGPGVRFNIPFLKNGPIPSINNNMAITFGLDITFGDGGPGWCYSRYNRNLWLNGEDCSVTEFWFPVGVQWNFFLTKVISVFGELEFAIAHRRWNYPFYCNGNNGDLCDYDVHDTDPELIFNGGARFMFTDNVGATVRLGWPMITAGINILF